jgi:hypothetical protein
MKTVPIALCLLSAIIGAAFDRAILNKESPPGFLKIGTVIQWTFFLKDGSLSHEEFLESHEVGTVVVGEINGRWVALDRVIEGTDAIRYRRRLWVDTEKIYALGIDDMYTPAR